MHVHVHMCACDRGALPAEVEAHQLARLHDALALLEDGCVSSLAWHELWPARLYNTPRNAPRNAQVRCISREPSAQQ